nr:hypothetical protein GCM10020092_076560 [Actinoplanes digitatis]
MAGHPVRRAAPLAPLAAEARRLEGQHLQVLEEWAETELEIGNCAAVADALTEHAERHPQRERLRAAQMTALFRCGRQAEALQVFEDVRRQLAEAYGLQPTPALEKLYRSILAEQRGHLRPAAAPPPQSLPNDLPDFVGRAEQLGEITDVVRHSTRQVIVVTGPAGIGKTTLAVRLAHTLQHDFPGGRILLRMREPDGTPRATVDLLAELAALTGLTDRMTGHPDQDSFHWRAWLGERRVLLMLDDAPDETAVRPLVPGAGPATVVVTSRRRMAGLADAHRIDVPSLTCAEAVDLLSQIIGRDRTTADPSAANAVVTAIGRLPLAVRIGGLKLAAMRLLPLRDFAERLASSRTVLDELVVERPRGTPPASPTAGTGCPGRTAPTSANWPPCLAPSLTLQDAATTLSCPPDEARRRLESLVDTGALLSPEPAVTARSIRYELPALVRLYARECVPTPPDRRAAAVG